jgi:hypothetical protein
MKINPGIHAFNHGELSPLMAGRVELKQYQAGCRRMRNFIITPQGPARRRPGTRFVAEVKHSSKYTWLAKFVFSEDQAYVLEIGDFYIRFFANHGVVGGPFELVTPWSEFDLRDQVDGTCRLSMWQSGDVIYCALRHVIQKITRTGVGTFAIAPWIMSDGPFHAIDPGNPITVYASAQTGLVTLTASAPLFQPLGGLAPNIYVDAMFMLEQKDVDSVKMWEPGKAVVIGDIRRSDGKNYKALTAGNTGTIKPTHSSSYLLSPVMAAKYDGDAGVQWEFQDPGYGWGVITAVASSTVATMFVLSRLPAGVVGAPNATPRHAFSAWNNYDGYPEKLAIFRERLIAAKGRKIWGSVAGDYESFAERDSGGVITPEMAMEITVESSRSDNIGWMTPLNQALMIGTKGDEIALYEGLATEPFGPGNAVARQQSEYGSRATPPAKVGEGVLFIQSSGRKLRDLIMAESVTERWAAQDVSIISEHVTRTGIIALDYQQEPDSVIWTVMADGRFAGFTISREQEVRGWHPHRIGGEFDGGFACVESVATIPAPSATHDELWMIVKRTINGVTKRYVEYMEVGHDAEDDPHDALYMDSALSLDSTRAANLTPGVGAMVKGSTVVVFAASAGVFAAGDVGKIIHYRYKDTAESGEVTWRTAAATITVFNAANSVLATIDAAFPSGATIPQGDWRVTVTTLTGLAHLEGQTVCVLADGAAHPDRTVTGGSITLDNPASKVHVGLSCPAVLQPMPIEMNLGGSSTRGKVKRASHVAIQFFQSGGCQYGRDEDSQLDTILTRGGGDNMDEAVPLFTGVKRVAFPDGYVDEALVTIVQNQPLPCTVVSITPDVEVED